MAALPLLLAALLLPLCAALPPVTPVQVGRRSCSGFPNFVEAGDAAKGLLFRADQADNSTVNGLPTTLRVTPDVDLLDITLPAAGAPANESGTTLVWACESGVLFQLDNMGGGLLDIDKTTGQFGFLRTGSFPELYQHTGDGVADSAGSVYLGLANVTAWAFKFVPGVAGGDAAAAADAFSLRLLKAQDEAPGEGEFAGFLKVVAV